MITEEQIELLVERLIERVNKSNEVFLKSIGNSIKQIKKLTPTQAQQLIQILKYGGDYNDIIKQIAKYTNLNIADIDAIFEEYAKKDQMFYKRFYDYRNTLFMPYQENMALQTQTMALANLTKQAMYNFTRSNAIGYTINGQFYNLRDIYNRLLDEALLNVSQGKETFDQAISGILKEVGGSGLKTIDFESGRSVRLDSMTRQYLKDGLRNLHNETQKMYGEEFDADGVEISVHTNPAPDHELVQGRQFSNEEFEKFQNDIDSKSYDGTLFPAISDETGHDRRSISQYNCYHTIFPIILGVSEPEYTDEQLQGIINQAHQKVMIDGKEYTRYECTQLQRGLERRIRKEKDIQILAKESGNDLLVNQTKQNITELTQKYHEVSQKSGLSTRMERAKVSGYKRKQTYTQGEIYALRKYISPDSIALNEKLRNNIKLDADEENMVKNLDNALVKTPNYKGKIVRTMEMPEPEEFIKQLEVGKEFSTNQYLSFSTKEGYNEYANIKIYVNDSKKSKDLTKINKIGENETLYKRNEKFITEKITKRKGIYYVYWKEK